MMPWEGHWMRSTLMTRKHCTANWPPKRLRLSCKVGHIDTSSFHVDGVYNSDQEDVPEGVIHITPGYSRDHRPDLNQVILQLLCEHQAGIPLWMGRIKRQQLR
jgi:transposase